jgi:acetyl-CoA carboxylase carboxyl transferase subunit alpha
VDDVLPEPLGGANTNPTEMAETIKNYLTATLSELMKISPEERIMQRIEKFSKMGFYEEVAEEEEEEVS